MAHRVIKSGSVTVRVFRVRVGRYRAFEVRYKLGDRIIRKVRASETAAVQLAHQAATAIGCGHGGALALTDADVASYRRAIELLKPTGIALETAVARFVEQWQAEHRQVKKSVLEAVGAYLDALQASGVSRDHWNHVKCRLSRFAAAFNCPLADVDAAALSAWLARQGAPRTIFNTRAALASFCNYAKSIGWLPENWRVLDAVKVGARKPPIEKIHIYTPDQLAAVLAVAQPNILPFLALSAFAGIRHAELLRLDWADLANGHVVVNARIAKTARRRLVPILPAAAALLEPFRRQTGPVVPITHVTRPLLRAFRAAGVQFHRNALRHSFVSYRLAQTRNAEQVALESGNTPRMILEHYRELVTSADAERWFAVINPVINARAKNHNRLKARLLREKT